MQVGDIRYAVQALRAAHENKLPQCKERLVDDGAYCALGAIAVYKYGKLNAFEMSEKYSRFGEIIEGRLGGVDCRGMPLPTIESTDLSVEIYEMNDAGFTFVEIADSLEEKYL